MKARAHALDLPTSGIDDEPLTPTAVSRERGTQNTGKKTPREPGHTGQADAQETLPVKRHRYRYRYCTGKKTPGEPGHRKKTTLHQYRVPYVPVPFYRSTFARAFMRVDTTSSLLVLLLGALSLLELWSSILSKNARALDVWLLYTFETCWPKAPLGGPPTRYRASTPRRRLPVHRASCRDRCSAHVFGIDRRPSRGDRKMCNEESGSVQTWRGGYPGIQGMSCTV
jgi:hypothetical protein